MFLDNVKSYGSNLPFALLAAAITLAFVVAFWLLSNALTRGLDDNREILQRQNIGYMVSRLAIMAALVIGMLNSLGYRHDEMGWRAIGMQAVEGAWVFVALLLVRVVVDKVVLARIDNLEAMRAGNVAVGVTEGGFYIGFGLILNGSLIGGAPTFWQGALSTVVFAVLGLGVTIGVYFLHELITRYDVRSGIRDNRLAAALEVAGVLISVSVVVRVGVAGDFTDWGSALAAFFATAVFAVIFLYVVRFLVDLLILRGCTTASIARDNLVVPAALMSGLFVVMALPVAAVVGAQL